MGWGGAYKQQNFIPHASGGWKFKVKEPADSASGGAPYSQYVLVWKVG